VPPAPRRSRNGPHPRLWKGRGRPEWRGRLERREVRSVSVSGRERRAWSLGLWERKARGETERVREEPRNSKSSVFILEDAIGPRLGLFGPLPINQGEPYKWPAS
jgi:hypothetical protein